jgi:hypothetical protein
LLPILLVGAGVGCGKPAASTRGKRPPKVEELPPSPPAVKNPDLRLELLVDPYREAKTYSLDMVYFTVRVTTRQVADVAIPGPPALRLVVRDLKTREALEPSPSGVRPRPPKPVPVSLGAGETVEIGPMDLGTLDLDPRLLEEGKKYLLEMEYLSGPGRKPRRLQQEVVLVPAQGLEFPVFSPLDRAAVLRPGVKVKILNRAKKLVREFYWSPDQGLVPPPSGPTG